MRGLAALSFLVAIATMMVGILTSSAYAYLDPGTGSIILQVLLGGVTGLALAGKLYWRKFRSLLGFKRKPEELREIRRDRG